MPEARVVRSETDERSHQAITKRLPGISSPSALLLRSPMYKAMQTSALNRDIPHFTNRAGKHGSSRYRNRQLPHQR